MHHSVSCLLACCLLVVSGSCARQAVTGSPSQGEVVISGGFDTDSRDHGRPVVLIAAALGVTPDVFRSAFSNVTPAKNGHPTAAEARANKKVLLDVLAPHGVTNERLDEVSDYYRYRPQAGERWRHKPATATAIIEDGTVTGFTITDAGAGYSTTPEVRVTGYEDVNVDVAIDFTTDLSTNGRIRSISVVHATP